MITQYNSQTEHNLDTMRIYTIKKNAQILVTSKKGLKFGLEVLTYNNTYFSTTETFKEYSCV
jgi:hypothetical protein